MRNKKILLALPIKQSTVLPGLGRALDYLGWEYQVFDYRALTYNEKLINLAGWRRTAYDLLNRRLISRIRDFRPILLFVVKGELILPQTLARIRRLGTFTLNWFPDDIQTFSLAKELVPSYDFFCHFDSYAVGQLKKSTSKSNIYHFPFAADILPKDSPPDFDGERGYDLTMVGNYYPVREEFLPRVEDLGLNIWGGERWKTTSLRQNYHGWLPFGDLFGVLKKTKIGINIQYPSPSWSLVNRAYDVMSCGAMLLTENKKEIKTKFVDGKHLVVFNGAGDLRDQATYFLKYKARRKRIAGNGYALVKERYTYVHQFKTLFKALGLL